MTVEGFGRHTGIFIMIVKSISSMELYIKYCPGCKQKA
jgi:hypothetical protein